MNKGQVSLEAIIGTIIFLVFFGVILAYSTNQGNILEDEKKDLLEYEACLKISQIIQESKYNNLSWTGKIDQNIYILNDHIFINFKEEPFSGISCKTINTNLDKQLTKGEIKVNMLDVNNLEVEQL